MRSWLAKVAIRKAIGLYLGEREIALSEMVATPLGPVEVTSRVESCSPNEMITVIEQMLESLRGKKRRRLSVAIGLPASRLFFGSRPLRGSTVVTPESVMQKLLCSSNISVEDLTVDLLRTTFNKQEQGSVAACRKKYMAAVLAVLQRCECRPLRAEPAPCALLRVAQQQCRAPRRAKTILRVFLGPQEALATLTVAGFPIGWRSVTLSPGSEGITILSAARTLQSQSKFHGLETTADYVMIHGQPDLQARLEAESLPSELGTRVLWNAGPEPDGPTIARGLAMGCLAQNVATFDLARLMKPRALLRDIFPWGELSCQIAIVILMALFFYRHSEQVNIDYLSAKAQCAQSKTLAGSTVTQLTDEKKLLTQKTEAIQSFLNSRTLWTNYLRNVATLLPPNVRISQIKGTSSLQTGRSGGEKKTFSLTAESAVMPDGTVPREIGEFLVTLRNHPMLKREFPVVQLSNVTQSQTRSGAGGSSANFAIVCLPGANHGAKGH
jgi:hypothetical protein